MKYIRRKQGIMNNGVFIKKLFNDNIWLKQVVLMMFFAGLTFCFLIISPLHIWTNGESGTDSSVFMTVAMMMDKGYMPYRDSFDHKGPLIYLINYVGRKIAVYRGVWVLEFLFLLITVCYLYKTARILCRRKIACLVIVVQMALLKRYLPKNMHYRLSAWRYSFLWIILLIRRLTDFGY